MIEDAVKEQVAACLAVEIPQELQDEVARTKTELDEAQRLLHNAYVLRDPVPSSLNTALLTGRSLAARVKRRMNFFVKMKTKR